ncbi:hypothetical protein HK405_009250, partial [Cladochytrium tenue]
MSETDSAEGASARFEMDKKDSFAVNILSPPPDACQIVFRNLCYSVKLAAKEDKKKIVKTKVILK